MAASKTVTAVFNGESFVAGNTHADSSVVDLSAAYGGALGIKITNGASGPTIALALQIQVSQDNSEFYDFGGPLVGSVTNSDIVSWGGIEIPLGVEYLKIVPDTDNTGQNVTVDADISSVDSL